MTAQVSFFCSTAVIMIAIALLTPSLLNAQGTSPGSHLIDPDSIGQPSTCPQIRGVGNPILLFHTYFKQTINVFNPKQDKTEVKLIYYRREKTNVILHRLIFRLKNTYANRFEYVGILSVVPKKEIASGRYNHFVIRYINSSDINDAIAILGVYEVDTDHSIPCTDQKQKWLSYILKNPYVVTKCEAEDRPDCVTSDDLTRLFSATFDLVEMVLGSFGFDVSTSQLGYDQVILDIFGQAFSEFNFAKVSDDK